MPLEPNPILLFELRQAVPVLGLFFLSITTGIRLEPNAVPFLPLPWFQESAAFVAAQWMIALIWVVVLAMIGRPWLQRHFRDFQPTQNEPETQQEKEPEASASGYIDSV